jgi:Tol biopolymer transport system component
MMVSVNGGMPEKLVAGTAVPDDQAFAPAWSADGKKIAFVHMLNGGASIGVMDIGSHQMVDLPGSRGLSEPTWSPDGNRLIAVTELSDKIISYDFDTQKWSVLASGSSMGSLNWSSDGKFLHYEGVVGKESFLMRVPARGGTPQKLASMNDVPRAQWCNMIACPGTWSGLLGDEPIIQRDLSTQEIYRLDLKF